MFLTFSYLLFPFDFHCILYPFCTLFLSFLYCICSTSLLFFNVLKFTLFTKFLLFFFLCVLQILKLVFYINTYPIPSHFLPPIVKIIPFIPFFSIFLHFEFLSIIIICIFPFRLLLWFMTPFLLIVPCLFIIFSFFPLLNLLLLLEI